MKNVLRAIARIEVGGQVGTGFLVRDDGLVLTALHVVAEVDKTKERPTFYKGQLQLRFGNPEEPATLWLTTATPAIDGDHPTPWSLAEDWVILRTADRPPMPPLDLGELLEAGLDRAWRTYGFPVAFPDGKLVPYTGKILLWGDRAQLYSNEATRPVAGVSGAPCIVDGRVVGIVYEALEDAKRNVQEGRLFARNILGPVAACPKLLTVQREESLAFELEVIEDIGSTGTLKRLADQMRLPADQVTEERIARRLLLGGIPEAARLLGLLSRVLEPAQRLALVDMVAAMSLDREPVETLALAIARLRPPDSVGVLVRAQYPEVEQWYLRRAGYAEWGPDVWLERVVEATAAGSEEHPRGPTEALCAEIDQAVRNRFPVEDSDLASRLLAGPDAWRPDYTFGVLLRGESREDVLEAICKRFPGARLLLIESEPLVGPTFRKVKRAAPDLEPTRENRLLADYRVARTEISRKR